MIKNIQLYVWIVITAVVFAFIATWTMMIATSNAYFFIFLYGLIMTPVLIVGFIVFLILQRTSFARFLNKRNIGIVCVIMAIVVMAPAVNFTLTTLPPSELLYYWGPDDEGQSMNISSLDLYYDSTLARKRGHFVYDDLAYQIEWEYDRNSNKFTFGELPMGHGWEISIRIEFTSDNTMTTYYLSNVSSPFNAELFDGLSWTGVKWIP